MGRADTLSAAETLDRLRGYRAGQTGAPFNNYETETWKAGYQLWLETAPAALEAA